MGSYFIFALVLTVLYIVYFAVNIIRDLYGKKGTEKTDEEVFDLGPMDSTEESVEVSENETGFKIGNETYGTETVPAASPAAQNGDTGKKDGTAKDRLERLKAKAEAQMEKVAPYLSAGNARRPVDVASLNTHELQRPLQALEQRVVGIAFVLAFHRAGGLCADTEEHRKCLCGSD